MLAVADGLVVAVRDGFADNTFSGPQGPPELDAIRGNPSEIHGDEIPLNEMLVRFRER